MKVIAYVLLPSLYRDIFPQFGNIINDKGEKMNSDKDTYAKVIRHRMSNDQLILSRSTILNMEGVNAAELGIIILITAWSQNPFTAAPITAYDVMEHFPNDKPMDILFALKSLVAKGLMQPNEQLDDALVQEFKDSNKGS